MDILIFILSHLGTCNLHSISSSVSWKFDLFSQEINEQPGSWSPKIEVHPRGVDFIVINVADPRYEEASPAKDQDHLNLILRQGMGSSIYIFDLHGVREVQWCGHWQAERIFGYYLEFLEEQTCRSDQYLPDIHYYHEETVEKLLHECCFVEGPILSLFPLPFNPLFQHWTQVQVIEAENWTHRIQQYLWIKLV